MLYMTSGNCT